MLAKQPGSEARRGFEEHWTEAAVLPRYLEVIHRAARRTGRDEIAANLEVR